MKIKEIIQTLGGVLVGDGDVEVKRIFPIERAEIGDISVVWSENKLNFIEKTKASCVVYASKHQLSSQSVTIKTEEPHVYFAKLTRLFAQSYEVAKGIHPSAIVSDSAIIGKNCRIAAYAVIDADAVIEDEVTIGAGSYIGFAVKIGKQSYLHPHVTILERCQLGARNLIHSGVVIGSDGFGFAASSQGAEKITHLAAVIVGDDVEIGANVTIDRGVLENTQIGHCVKIDNQVHIAHNVRIGEHSILAGMVGVAGSAVIGKRCYILGQAGISDGVSIADDVVVSFATKIAKSIDETGQYTSSLHFLPHREWLKANANFKHFDMLKRRIVELENQLKKP